MFGVDKMDLNGVVLTAQFRTVSGGQYAVSRAFNQRLKKLVDNSPWVHFAQTYPQQVLMPAAGGGAGGWRGDAGAFVGVAAGSAADPMICGGAAGPFASKPAPTGSHRLQILYQQIPVGAGLPAKRPGQTTSMPDQLATHFSSRLLIQLQPEMLLAGNLRSHRQPIAIHQPITRQRRHFRTG